MKEQRATGTKLIGVFQNTSELVFALSFIIGSSEFAVMAAVDKADRSANCQRKKRKKEEDSFFQTISLRTYFCYNRTSVCELSALDIYRGFSSFQPHSLLSTVQQTIVKRKKKKILLMPFVCLFLVF